VRGEWGGSRSPLGSAQNWATEMVVGLQLRTASPPKETKTRSAVITPKERTKEIINNNSPKKTAPSNTIIQQEMDKLNQQILLLKKQEQQYLDKISQLEKEIEVSKIQLYNHKSYHKSGSCGQIYLPLAP
jgi:hypothetical protein